MFGDFIGQVGATVGAGDDLNLGDAFGSNVTFRTQFATGDIVFYLATTRTATKRELGWGEFTQGTPDKITRNVLRSTQVDAKVNWAVDDVYYVYSVPVGEVQKYLAHGELAELRPDWLEAGSRWVDPGTPDRWIAKRAQGSDAADDIEEGRHHLDEGIFVPNQRRRWTAVGAASKTIAAADTGGVFTFDNAAASRTVTLPAHADAGIGHGFKVGFLGLTSGGQYGIVLTPSAGDGIEGGADAATKTIPGGVRFDIEWDEPSDTWRITYLNTVPVAWHGRRQTVAAGPVDTAGLPTFLPSTDANLDLGSQNITAAARFVVAAANGWDHQGRPADRVGVSFSNLTWSGLTASRAAATPNFCYVAVNADGSLTTGSTLLAPIYQWGGTPATTAGQFTFNIAEMKGYLGNGTTAPEAFVVFVGEAATDGSGVISTVAYAYNGRYDSGYTDTLPAAATPVSKSHNIGVLPGQSDFRIQCKTAEGGFAVGNEVGLLSLYDFDGTNIGKPSLGVDRTAMSVVGSTVPWLVRNKSTAAQFTLTLANWKYRFIADRGWG
jgi:hypothetical protein